MSHRLAAAELSDGTEASQDRLTLRNRVAILQFLTGQFARRTRDGVSVALAMADLVPLSRPRV